MEPTEHAWVDRNTLECKQVNGEGGQARSAGAETRLLPTQTAGSCVVGECGATASAVCELMSGFRQNEKRRGAHKSEADGNSGQQAREQVGWAREACAQARWMAASVLVLKSQLQRRAHQLCSRSQLSGIQQHAQAGVLQRQRGGSAVEGLNRAGRDECTPAGMRSFNALLESSC